MGEGGEGNDEGGRRRGGGPQGMGILLGRGEGRERERGSTWTSYVHVVQPFFPTTMMIIRQTRTVQRSLGSPAKPGHYSHRIPCGTVARRWRFRCSQSQTDHEREVHRGCQDQVTSSILLKISAFRRELGRSSSPHPLTGLLRDTDHVTPKLD